MLRAGPRGKGPHARAVTGSSTFKLLSFTDTQTFEPEKHGQAASGFLGYALACPAVRQDGHRRRGTVTLHWQVPVRWPVGGHHDAAWLPPSRALPRIGGSNNPK